MAGYIIYSLDWDKFRALVEQPTPAQLRALAGVMADELAEWDGEFDDGDPMQDWPTDPEGLTRIIAQRLPLPDWYGDLSDTGKNVWEGMIFSSCMNDAEYGMDLGFRVDSDGVYWDVIDVAGQHLGVKPDNVSDVALSTFGLRPFRYHQPAKPWHYEDWHAMHSMHPPDEVQAMLRDLESARTAIEKSRNEQAQTDYEILMPALQTIADDGRMLFVQTDT